jgi:hypothetical protein
LIYCTVIEKYGATIEKEHQQTLIAIRSRGVGRGEYHSMSSGRKI